MNRAWPVLLAALPGLVLVVLAAGFSLAPVHSDLPGYFVPLRERTAAVLVGERDPYWNPDVGCGEPFFANPQSGLLYPPSWFAAWLGSHRGIGVEAGLHLALLGLGCALLAQRLGAGTGASCAAGLGAALAGPTADAIGVLNNLETLAWAPWVWWGAVAGRPAVVALAVAAAWLGAEPQLALLVAVTAVLLAPSWRCVAAIGLGLALVALQLLPFVAWVAAGNRGSHQVVGTPSGGLLLSDLVAVIVPGHELAARPDVFLSHPFLPAWVLLFAAVAAAGRATPARRLAWLGLVMLVIPVVTVLPGGTTVWALVTRGMVRFPARLVLLAVVALAPAAATAVGTVVRRRQLVLVVAVGGAAALAPVAAHGPIAAVGVLAAGLALVGSGPGLWVAVGSAVLVVPFVAVLHVAPPPPAVGPVPCAAAQAGQRVYIPEPSWDMFAWVAADPLSRGRALGLGYSDLGGERRFVRTFAPFAARRLAQHLAAADRGPAGRWWLDALAASRLTSHHPIASFPRLCDDGDLVVYANPTAFPETQILAAMPQPGERLASAGEVLRQVVGDDLAEWQVRVTPVGGVLVRSATPDRGWQFRVDGRLVAVRPGPGILHGVDLAVGEHLVTARYRPPGLVLGAAISLLALIGVGVLGLRSSAATGPV